MNAPLQASPVASAPAPVALEATIGGVAVKLEAAHRPLWWQLRGLSFTSSGYGRRIPTRWMVRLPGSARWRRVYCCIYSNAGTCYVDGPVGPDGKRAWIVVS